MAWVHTGDGLERLVLLVEPWALGPSVSERFLEWTCWECSSNLVSEDGD